MKKPFCINLSRYEAENWYEELNPEEYAWISICCPEFEFSENEHLDKLSKIKLKFYDITRTLMWGDEILHPASTKDALDLVLFIKENSHKNIIVNCFAGVSRSSAICKFLRDLYFYEWSETYQHRAAPNEYLYEIMANEHYKILEEEIDYKHCE